MTTWYWTLSRTHFSLTEWCDGRPTSPTQILLLAARELTVPPPLEINCFRSSVGALQSGLMKTEPSSENKTQSVTGETWPYCCCSTFEEF